MDQQQLAPKSERNPWWHKALATLLFIGLACVLWWIFREQLSMRYLASRENELRDFQQQRPILVLGLAFIVYVAVTGLSIPGAAVLLTVVYGWYFGFGTSVVLISFASTAGATLAFLLSRYLFQASVQKNFGGRLAKFNEALRREGAFYLFTLRLIPAVPFFIINVVMGLTPMKPWTFWWVSQLGMLPGTCVYVWAGASVPSLKPFTQDGTASIPWQIVAAFAMLGIFPIATKKIVSLIRRRPLEFTEKENL